MAYVTAAEVKTYIGGSAGTGDDTLIGDLIDHVQKFIETYTDRVFEVSADSTHTFDAELDTSGRRLWLDGDLCAITTVRTNADGAAGEKINLLPSIDYLPVPRTKTPYYALDLMRSSSYEWTYTTNPEMGVTVEGKWGYSTTPPEDIKLATLEIVKTVYRARAGNADTFVTGGGIVITPNNVPRTALLTLDAYKRRS